MKSARRRVLLVSLSVFLLLACSTAATAAASPARAAKSASFCGVAKGFAKSLRKPPATQSLATAPAQASFKTNLTKVVAAKGKLVSAAPGSLKNDVTKVIAFYALLKSDLVKAKWTFALLAAKPALLIKLETAATKTAPSFNRLQLYFRKTCKY
jgi:hypothetical protein